VDVRQVPVRVEGGGLVRPQPVAPVPRFALTIEEAAASLGYSESTFKRYVLPHVQVIRKGSTRAIPVPELERWARENAAIAGGE
jgi:hypothetical protein